MWMTLALAACWQLLAPGQQTFIAPHPELSADQKLLIESGGQVFITMDVAGFPWPRVYIYQYIDATPEDAAAVFTDYERHKSFIPNLKTSTVSQVVDRVTAEVDYVLRIPLFADERYTVRDQLSSYDDGTSYEVRWTLVRASSTRGSEGNLRFEPYQNERLQRQGTLMSYYNFITPGSRLAGIGFIKRKGLQQLRDTAHAIVRQVQSARARDPALFQKQLAALRAAMGS
jgi:hypothetical protein